jgi:hypothetical protein
MDLRSLSRAVGGAQTATDAPCRRSRWRARAIALPALLFVLSWATASPAAAAEKLLQISSDPYIAAPGQHKTEVEPDTFAFGSTIVSTFQVGRIFDGGATNIGFATSVDAGKTWTEGFLPASTIAAKPPGSFGRGSDASVAFDAKHNVWMISWLGVPVTFPNPLRVDVMVSRSTDGLTWGSPVLVNASGHFNDKNWTVCDDTASSPHFGNCYTEFDDASQNDLELMSTSTDGGLTWGAGLPTANGAHGIGGQPLVQPNGNVVVPYIGLDSPFFLFTISSFRSTNGGFSWSASTLVSEADFHQPAGNIRAGIPLPTAEIDRSGRIYVVWSDCRFRASCATSDLVLSTSDNGLSWTPVKRIPLDPIRSAVDHFVPGVAVDRSTSGAHAHLALAYYFYPVANCTEATCQLKVGFVSSVNGGRTWNTAETLAGPMSVDWLPETSQGRMFGDYISTSIVPGSEKANPVFAVARPPTGGALCAAGPPPSQHCDVATFTTAKEQLRVLGGNQSGESDPVLARSPHAGTASPNARRAPTSF